MTDQKIIIPAKALKLIEGYEGLISGTPGKPEKHVRGAYERKYFPYQGAADKKGVLTIGRGHVVKKGEDFSEGLTLQEVNDLFINDLHPRAQRLHKLLKGKYTEDQFAAALSCFYNIEEPWIVGRSPGDAHRAGNFKLCAERLMLYNISNGLRRLGLWRRRGSEALCYLTGEVIIAKDVKSEDRLFARLKQIGVSFTRPSVLF